MPSHYTRAGVEGAAELASKTSSPSLWTKFELQYKTLIKSKGGTKLSTLDDECDKLSEKLRSDKKKTPSITKKELLSVVEWKFAKGKPRYALMKHLNSNGDETVKKCSEGAFRKAADGDVEGASKVFCELRGVGPATASAVLCLYRPDLFCFMDDEVIECLYPAKRGYTLKIYLEVNSLCSEIADGLGEEWTPHRVGRALWSAARARADGVTVDVEGEEEEEVVDDVKKKVTKKGSKKVAKKRARGGTKKESETEETEVEQRRSSRYPKRNRR